MAAHSLFEDGDLAFSGAAGNASYMRLTGEWNIGNGRTTCDKPLILSLRRH